MTDNDAAGTEAMSRGMLDLGDGVWESLEVDAPSVGAAHRRGPANVAMVVLEDRGRHVVEQGDAQRYSTPALEFVIGAHMHRVAWRDATTSETEPLLAQERAREETWQRGEELRVFWSQVKDHFLRNGETFPGEPYPSGEFVHEVVDAMFGSYYIVLNEGRWMWWVQLDRYTQQQWEAGHRPGLVAYRLPWDADLAGRIRETEQMPDLTSTSL